MEYEEHHEICQQITVRNIIITLQTIADRQDSLCLTTSLSSKYYSTCITIKDIQYLYCSLNVNGIL